MSAVEYGRFQDPVATYVVTSSSMPDTVRVYAGEPHTAEMICTISNLSIRPLPSWNAKWHSNLPDWKRRFVAEAVATYRRYRVSPDVSWRASGV